MLRELIQLIGDHPHEFCQDAAACGVMVVFFGIILQGFPLFEAMLTGQF